MEKVFYCNLSPLKCKPYNPWATCSGFGSLLKTSSILSYKTQPCAETLQASHLLTISLLRIWILRHFYENGVSLPQCNHSQKHCRVFPVSVLVFLWTQFWISSSSWLSHKASGNEMLLVAKEVSFPEFANCPVALKRAFYGSGISLLLNL